jgi:hypothetical protein
MWEGPLGPDMLTRRNQSGHKGPSHFAESGRERLFLQHE